MFNFFKTLYLNIQSASVAQWLDHWYSKAGDESSILSRDII